MGSPRSPSGPQLPKSRLRDPRRSSELPWQDEACTAETGTGWLRWGAAGKGDLPHGDRMQRQQLSAGLQARGSSALPLEAPVCLPEPSCCPPCCAAHHPEHTSRLGKVFPAGPGWMHPFYDNIEYP